MIASAPMSEAPNPIRKLREKNGLTQDDLVARSGLSIATIQRAERGERLSAASLASIAAAFNVPANTVIAGDEGYFEPYVPLEAITTGRALVTLLRGCPRMHFSFCELDNLEDAKAIEALFNFGIALVAHERAMSPIAQVTRELEAKTLIADLTARGFRIGGATFAITAYEVDEEEGMGSGIVYGKWDETHATVRVGRGADDIERAHVMDDLGKFELPTTGVVFPPQRGWADLDAELGAPVEHREGA